jgi:hypothetical protein
MSLFEDFRQKVGEFIIGEEKSEDKKIYKAFEKIKEPHERNPDKTDYEKVGVSEYEMVQQSSYYYNSIYFQASDKEKMLKEYREMANFPEVADALDDICDEAIVQSEEGEVMHLQIQNEKILKNENILKNIQAEYNHLIEILDFHNNAFNLFRKFYVEAELFAEMVINPSSPQDGIRKVVMLPTETMFVDFDDYEQIKGFRQKIDINDERVRAQVGSDKGIIRFKNTQVAYVNSGIFTKNAIDEKICLSYIERAKVAYRQLKWMEDSLVIYRIVRAPERRVFTIDVGNLPKKKAEEYMRDIINRYKQRKIYNPQTGDIDVGRNVLAMTEDFWLPKRGDAGPTVQNLPGGDNLGNLGDVVYFAKKLYKAMKVPTKRVDEEQQAYMFSGRETQELRAEIKFAKYVQRVRGRFLDWFVQIFRTHLKLKGLWDKYNLTEEDFHFIFEEENEWRETKMLQNWSTRLEVYQKMLEFEHKDFSRSWLKKNILKMSDEDIKENDESMEADMKKMILQEVKFQKLKKKYGADLEGTGDAEAGAGDGDGKAKDPFSLTPDVEKGTGKFKPYKPPARPSRPKLPEPAMDYDKLYGIKKEKKLITSSEFGPEAVITGFDEDIE